MRQLRYIRFSLGLGFYPSPNGMRGENLRLRCVFLVINRSPGSTSRHARWDMVLEWVREWPWRINVLEAINGYSLSSAKENFMRGQRGRRCYLLLTMPFQTSPLLSTLTR